MNAALPSVERFIDGEIGVAEGEPSVTAVISDIPAFRADRLALLHTIGRSSTLPPTQPTPTLWEAVASRASNPKIAHSLPELAAFDPAGTFVSHPVSTASGAVAVIARPTTNNTYLGIFDIAVHDANGWRILATLGKGQNIGEPYTRPKPVHVTTSLIPDFQVFTAGGDYSGSVIVSDVGGKWHLVPFKSEAGSAGFEMPGVTISGLTLTARGNNCVPNCADGTAVSTDWRFYPPDGDFTPSG
jgi:hypothetical protein